MYTVSQKRIPDIINCNLRKDYEILIVFGTNISDTTGYQTTVEVPTYQKLLKSGNSPLSYNR